MSALVEFGQLGGAIPLLQAAVLDERVEMVTLEVDHQWRYRKIAARCSSGWNPFRSEIYMAANSALDGYCRRPGAEVREHNENDDLATEAAFVAHDYLHIWALHELRDIDSTILSGSGSITECSLEADVAWMLATEAVATVGLDYWFLSQRSFRDRLDVGSLFTTLTVAYESSNADEYIRFRPDLEVMSPGFLAEIAAFYCQGAFSGFSLADVRRSPATLKWLRHEVTYGEKQRIYTRQWLRHLAGLPAAAQAQLAGPVEAPERFDEVVAELGRRLWSLVVEGDHRPRVSMVRPDAWIGAPQAALDFRYDNALALGPDRLEQVLDEGTYERASVPHLIEQLLRHRACPEDDLGRAAMTEVVRRGDPSLALWAARNLPAVDHEHAVQGPKELFLLG